MLPPPRRTFFLAARLRRTFRCCKTYFIFHNSRWVIQQVYRCPGKDADLFLSSPFEWKTSPALKVRCDLKLIVEGQLNSTTRMLTGRTLETKSMLWQQHSWHKFRLRSSRQLKVSLPVVASRSWTHKGTFTSFHRSEGENKNANYAVLFVRTIETFIINIKTHLHSSQS